ncbi:MAG TPA: phosphatase PAP2 family protein [Gemmatimonadaceae bacterium]
MISTDTKANVIQKGDAAHHGRADPALAVGVLALGWLCAYVAVSAALLAAGGHWRFVTVHVLVLGASAWAVRSKTSTGEVVRDLLPLFVAPLLYVELPSIIAVLGTGYHDSAIQSFEALVFGDQPSRSLATRFPWRPASEVLHAGYLAYYVMIFVPALLLFKRGDRRGFGELVFALTVTYTICWVTFVTFPVQGPRYLWPAPGEMPDGPIRRLAVNILEAGSSRGAAFPSSHMAVATVVALMSYRWMRTQAWLWVTIALLVGLGAVYGGFHYGVDVVAGFVLGAAVSFAVIAHSRTTIARDVAA